MAHDIPGSKSPLDAFVEAFRNDVRDDAIRPLAEYLSMFPGDGAGIARAYREFTAAAVRGTRAEEAPLAHADRIGPYRVLRQIGRGGQASVHLAEHVELHRQVALKVLDPGHRIEPTRLARFRREAEITSKLDHPGICTVYESGEDHGILWIAMRYVEGESLATKISSAKDGQASGTTTFVILTEREGRDVPPAEPHPSGPHSGPQTWAEIARVLAVFEKTAQALHVAHEAGVIHRDIKPGNLIITKAGDPVILDFGLAHEVEGDQPALTITGDVIGTPAYMSPEQLALHQIRLDRRTDVYSLGVSLYECLALKRPFEAPTREGLYQAIMTKEPPDLKRLNPAVPTDLRVVVATAIEKDRDRRYQTALDLAEDLRRVRTHEGILAKPPGPLVRVRRWSQRNPALATALIGLFVLLATGLTIAIVLLGETRRERDAKESALGALKEADLLADVTRLAGLKAIATDLWPADSGHVTAMTTWIEDASRLQERLPDIERLRRLGDGRTGEGKSRQTDDSRRDFRYEALEKYVADMAAFCDPDPSKGTLADVRRRLRFAQSVRQETIESRQAQWATAIRSISDVNECPVYGGLRIVPQLGLVPIGRDPGSGLWEFSDVVTAANHQVFVPERRRDGSLDVPTGCGLIFVLLPGGTFWMGSQDVDEDAPNFDASSQPSERPPGRVVLDPFFLSKFECTQGQWEWVTGSNPSRFADRPGQTSRFQAFGPRHPVEGVSWTQCVRVLANLGLDLPTEAQWEYACRGNTATPWSTGVDRPSLQGAANFIDRSAKEVFPTNPRDDSITDGWAYHAPVGCFRPNPLGLHDMHGNVAEWCRDAFSQDDVNGGYVVRPNPGHGERVPTSAAPYRVFRGGSFYDLPGNLRSACRGRLDPTEHNATIGVRPARKLDR